jgi:hypothetical protein
MNLVPAALTTLDYRSAIARRRTSFSVGQYYEASAATTCVDAVRNGHRCMVPDPVFPPLFTQLPTAFVLRRAAIADV